MGDRGNIKVGDIYFYTHWDGSNIKQILKSALIDGHGRWQDEPYLNRIIFCEMIKNSTNDETGYGISTNMTDNDNSILYVSVQTQTIECDGVVWSFDEYIKQNFNSCSNCHYPETNCQCDIEVTNGGEQNE